MELLETIGSRKSYAEELQVWQQRLLQLFHEKRNATLPRKKSLRNAYRFSWINANGTTQDFQKYSRRLVKDLEAKGIIRTALEGVNLARYADKTHDVLMAECIRTFSTVTFPANVLLMREEVETHAKPHVPSDETPNKKWTVPKHATPLPSWAIVPPRDSFD